jgi:hypothetical protein
MGDQELAEAVHAAAAVLEEACQAASEAGLSVSLSACPKREGGCNVWADVRRPPWESRPGTAARSRIPGGAKRREVPLPARAQQGEGAMSEMIERVAYAIALYEMRLKTPTLAAFCEASPEARAVAVAQAVETYSGAACAAIEAMRPELIKLAEAARKDRAEDFNAVLLSIDAAIKPIDRATP